MNYIIKIGETLYFAGWDSVLGHIKVTDDRKTSISNAKTYCI